ANTMKKALARARAVNHPYTLAWTLNFAAVIHQIQGEVDATRRMADECLQHSQRHEFPFWLAGAHVMHGWSRIAGGETTDDALAEAREGLADWKKTGAVAFSPYYLGCLIEGYRMLGRPPEGVDALESTIASIQRTGERWWEPELQRLRGELLLDMNPERDAQRAEACFREAANSAKRHVSRSLL